MEPGHGEGLENDGFLYNAMYCTRYTGRGTGKWNHCFLLCPSLSLSLSLSRAVCLSHKTGKFRLFMPLVLSGWG